MKHIILCGGKNMMIVVVLIILLLLISTIFYIYNNNNNVIEETFILNNNNSTTKIPLHIYQTWHTLNLPKKMQKNINKLKQDNPEFEHHLYDDKMCRDFIKDNYDKEVVDAFDSLRPGAFKADLWRYCVLYKKGGIYLDIKYQCEDGFKLIELTDVEYLFVGEYESDDEPNPFGAKPILINENVYTGLMITKPYNPIFNIAIQKICNNVKTNYYDKFLTGQTGPALLRRCFKENPIVNINYGYYEINHRGFIKHMYSNRIILSFYPEYRFEQKQFGKTMYWKDMWKNKIVYK